MKETNELFSKEKPAFYEELCTAAAGLTEGERHPLANLANLAALLGGALTEINWAGFYLVDGEELVLAPFWGKPACLRIAKGRGVCGKAWETGLVQRVADVHEFPGHIACDAASASEIVLPLMVEDRMVGVLDIDSPIKARFDAWDEAGLRRFVSIAEAACDWAHCGYLTPKNESDKA